MKGIKKGLAILLVLCTLLSMVVMTGAGAAPQSADAPEAQTMAANDGFMKMVLLDGGRGHISVENVKAVINEMALYDYDYLMLGIGNDGLRFLLDDMSVEANGQNYDSDKIKDAIIEKNNELAPKARGEWSETDMNTILAYAREKGISIVPMLNTPGHATSIVAAMTACGITNCSLASSGTDTKNITINIENEQAAAFAKALVKKYITWFSSRGCTYFNLGCDEYGGNAGNTQDKTNQAITAYVTDLCNAMTAMTPMAFTDVLCACSNVPDNLVGIHWYKNKLQNNSNVRANSNWYYVVGTHGTGNPNEWATYEKALKCVATDRVAQDYDGSLLAIWNDYNNPFTAEEVANVDTLIRTQATNNPDYFTSLPKTETVEDTIPVGTSKPYTQDGHVGTAGTYTTSDGIASYTIKHNTETTDPKTVLGSSTSAPVSGNRYVIATGTNSLGVSGTNYTRTALTATTPGTEITEASVWTIQQSGDGYTISKQINGTTYYLALTGNMAISQDLTLTTSAEKNVWSYSNGVFSQSVRGMFDNYDYKLRYSSNRWSVDQRNHTVVTLYNVEEVSGTTTDSTTITFTGVAPGTTYVTVGNTRYIIHVKEDLTGKTLPVEHFISNSIVWDYTKNSAENGGGNAVSQAQSSGWDKTTIDAANVYGEQGAALKDLVPARGNWAWATNATQTVFWKGVVHPSNSKQTNEGQDYSLTGEEFYYIRYYAGKWAYSKDRSAWTAINEGEQVVAYYLQKTEVTNEITTYVKDWAYSTSSIGHEANRAQKALSFAVVLSSGMYPGKEKEIYSDTTLIYWDNLPNLGVIRFENTGLYRVSKITYTMGSHTDAQGNLIKTNTNWTANDGIQWEKTQDGFYDEHDIWTADQGGEPVINGAALQDRISAGNSTGTYGGDKPTGYNGTWGANDAVLIRIHLETVKTEDSLTVRYWDESSKSLIYDYTINVQNTAGEDPHTFLNSLTPPLVNGELQVDAEIKNAAGTPETIKRDLTKLPELQGKYSSGLYDYIGSEVSEDGKTLTLKYNLNASGLSKNFVLDFGLPVTIPLTEIAGNIENVTGVTVTVPQSSNAVVNTDRSITVTLSKVMTSAIPMTVTVTYKDGTTTTFTVGLTPATTVYYEEGFGTFPAGSITGAPKAGNQAAEVAGQHINNYGYDAAYANAVGDSNGTVAKLETGAQGTFTFTGTGVDVYARTMKESGKVMVYVYDGPTLKRLITADTRQLGPQSAENQSANGTAYNVPIVRLSGLSAGEHTIRMLAVQTKDENGAKQSWPVYIDGFRVHGTLDVVNTQVYKDDGESNPTFVELRNSVLNAVIGDTKPDSIYADQIANKTMSQVYAANEKGVNALIVSKDTSSALTGVEVKNLLDNGPKNEIYLKQGESLVFTVSATSAQIGLKALNAATSYKINDGMQVSLNTSTDMFYPLDISADKTITITNTGSGILSITELKLFGAAATVEPMSAPALTRALVSLGFESEPVAATATLNITVQCGDKAVPVTLTHDGMSNETHTFTAAEIKAAVEQALPEGYTVADVTFSDVTVACGEASDVAFTAAETPAPVGLLQKIVQIAVKIVKKIFSWF